MAPLHSLLRQIGSVVPTYLGAARYSQQGGSASILLYMLGRGRYRVLTCTRDNVIHAGRWHRTPYSVAVRYKDREVSTSLLDPKTNAKATARELLSELITRDSERAHHKSGLASEKTD